MKSREILKLNERYSLVETDGKYTPYVVCSCYDDTKPEGSKWNQGQYFCTLEGAIKYAARKCFEPMHRYVLVETDVYNNISEETFYYHEDAYKEFKKRFDDYSSDEDCCLAEITDDENGNIIGKVLFYDKEYSPDDITLKIIDVIV